MSGAGSRARRVAAISRAHADVYASRGAEIGANPFTDERQQRLYAKEYAFRRSLYWRMERMGADVAAAYGWQRVGDRWEGIA